MKLLILGLLPLIIFWVIEESHGTLAGILAASIWSVGECLYEYLRFQKIQKLTLVSGGLVVGLGGLSWYLDNSIFFKFQPAIIEMLFVILILWFSRGGVPALYKMAEQTRPELKNLPPHVKDAQKKLFSSLSKRLILIMLIHVFLLIAVALRGTTSEWIFIKGVGFAILLGIWMFGEFLFIKKSQKK